MSDPLQCDRCGAVEDPATAICVSCGDNPRSGFDDPVPPSTKRVEPAPAIAVARARRPDSEACTKSVSETLFLAALAFVLWAGGAALVSSWYVSYHPGRQVEWMFPQLLLIFAAIYAGLGWLARSVPGLATVVGGVFYLIVLLTGSTENDPSLVTNLGPKLIVLVLLASGIPPALRHRALKR